MPAALPATGPDWSAFLSADMLLLHLSPALTATRAYGFPDNHASKKAKKKVKTSAVRKSPSKKAAKNSKKKGTKRRR